MDELTIAGKKYISSKRASEITGYVKDYVGQLARGGKIPATRVGRAWYVDEQALRQHERTGTFTVEEVQLAPAVDVSADTKEVAVATPRKVFMEERKFATISHALLSTAQAHLPRTWQPIRYLKDESGFIPSIFQGVDTLENTKQTKEISDSRENNEVRIRILKKTLEPKPKVAPIVTALPVMDLQKVKVAEVLSKQPLVKKIHKPFIFHPNFSFAVPAALIVVAAGLLASGLLVSSHTTIVQGNSPYTANVFQGYEYAKEVLQQTPFIQSGAASVSTFFSTLKGSFGAFFFKGFDFIKSLPSQFQK